VVLVWREGDEASRPRVLYIAGVVRSGTTLLSNLLAQLPGTIGVGELRWFWRGLTVPDHQCGCGAPFSACPFWRDVIARLGRRGARDPQEVMRLQREAVGDRHHWAKSVRAGRRPTAEHQAYTESIVGLCEAISSVTGGATIVDSSKTPSDAALLLASGALDVTIVHIVRDPRGNLLSRLRRADEPHAGRPRPRDALATAATWVANNVAASALARSGSAADRIVVTYEGLARDPAGTIGMIAELAGLGDAPSSLFTPDGVFIEAVHSISGNEKRFRVGAIPVSVDDEWRGELHAVNRAIMTTTCGPLAAYYRRISVN
jgi:hypothetical protein